MGLQATDDQCYLITAVKWIGLGGKIVKETLTPFNPQEIKRVQQLAKSEKLQDYFILRKKTRWWSGEAYCLAILVKTSRLHWIQSFNSFSYNDPNIEVVCSYPVEKNE